MVGALCSSAKKHLAHIRFAVEKTVLEMRTRSETRGWFGGCGEEKKDNTALFVCAFLNFTEHS